MDSEIAEQSVMLAAQAPRWQDEARAALQAAGRRANVALVGRGSSGNACTFAAYVTTLATGRPPIELRPWLTAQPAVPVVDLSDLAAHVYSVSGQSADVVAAARWLGERGAFVVGVTNARGACALADASDVLIRLGAGEERAVPATKTFTAQLVVAAALAGYEIVEPAVEVTGALAELPASAVDRVARFLAPGRTVAIVARGPALGPALDAALKLRECAAIPCAAYSAAELMHGSIGAIGESDRVVLFDDGAGAGGIAEAARAVIDRSGSALVVRGPTSDDDLHAPGSRELALELPVCDWARGIVFIGLMQRVALALARARGIDADAPPGLTKITHTP